MVVVPCPNLARHHHDSLLLRRLTDISSVLSSVASTAQLHRSVRNPKVLLATFEAPHYEGTTFGGFDAVAIATGSRGRDTTGLITQVWAYVSSPPKQVRLTPRWANRDRQRSFSASRPNEIARSIVTRIISSPAVVSRTAVGAAPCGLSPTAAVCILSAAGLRPTNACFNSSSSNSHFSSGYCPSGAFPYCCGYYLRWALSYSNAARSAAGLRSTAVPK